MDERTRLVRRYLDAIERFDSEAALACCATEMTQTEYPNMLTPMTRVRGVEEMGKGVVAAEAMLVEQRYEITASYDAGEVLVMELVWCATLKPGPLPEKTVCHFTSIFIVRDGLISSQRNHDCCVRPDAA